MGLTKLRLCTSIVIVVFTLTGCGGAAKPVAPKTEGEKPDTVLGIPVGWSDANRKSAELYQAKKFAESIAVLEAFAKANPKFADVELMLGETLLTMPALPELPDSARLDRAATHLRRGLELATDEYGRTWGTKTLERVAQERKELGLPPAAQ